MNNDFDKKIKELMEASQPADMGFDLDRSAVWDKIQHKKKAAVVIPFSKWMSHAAAVLIGILLCLPFLFHAKKERVQTVAVVKSVMPATQIIRDTVFVENKGALLVKPQIQAQSKVIHYATETSAHKGLEPVQAQNKLIEAPVINNNAQPIAATMTPKTPLKVLHLMDMDNENAIPKSKPVQDYTLFNKIIFSANATDKSETVTMQISKNIFHSNN
jgi:hypothetical protein